MSMIINPFRFGAGGGGGGVSARYWRVLMVTNNGDTSFTGVERLEMYAGPSRVDQTIGKTKIFSSQGGLFGLEVAANAFNDTNGTFWANGGGGSHLNCWLGCDFGADISITAFAVQHRNESPNIMPKQMELQYSADNSTWTTLFTTADQTSWQIFEMRFFEWPDFAPSYSGSPHGAHRYWRIHPSRASDGGSTFSAAEVEFRATPGGSDQATGGTASAHSNFPGETPSLAFDNNSSTLWSANGSATDGWLKYDFGSGNAVEVAQVLIQARTPSFFGQTPRWGQIEFSDDDTNWSVAWEFSLAEFTAGMSQTTTDPAYV